MAKPRLFIRPPNHRNLRENFVLLDREGARVEDATDAATGTRAAGPRQDGSSTAAASAWGAASPRRGGPRVYSTGSVRWPPSWPERATIIPMNAPDLRPCTVSRELTKAQVTDLAEFLLGTCGSLEYALEALGLTEDPTVADHMAIDGEVLECDECNWWVEASEVDEDGRCEQCAVEAGRTP